VPGCYTRKTITLCKHAIREIRKGRDQGLPAKRRKSSHLLRLDSLDTVHAGELVEGGECQETLQKLWHACLIRESIAEEFDQDGD